MYKIINGVSAPADKGANAEPYKPDLLNNRTSEPMSTPANTTHGCQLPQKADRAMSVIGKTISVKPRMSA